MEKNQELLDKNIQDNWLAKVGVHKPYTVFVCIMAIIVLGVFAFSKMSVDLFPSMNLPYAVVVLNPNESYLMEEFNDAAIARAKDMAVTAGDYTDLNDPNIITAEQALRAVLDGKMEQAATAGKLLMYYRTLAEGEAQSEILASVMPSNRQLESLTDDALMALSGVNGIKNTNSTTMFQFGLVMLTLEYNTDATVELTALSLAFDNMALDDTVAYGTKFNKTILKIDPSLLAVMNVTVAYEGETDDDKNREWLENEVLNKISTTVGVGTVTSNIDSSMTNQDQAWQGSNVGLVDTYSIAIQKSSNAVTTEVCANVIVTLEKLKAENPNFTYDIISSQGDYINESIGSVGENLIVGGVLALLVLFLFLRSIKMTLAIGISIPLALVGTFVAMYFMGINLNIISMAGLALAVGMLVDNSVVVLENIFRLRNKGMSLKDACIKGASQIMMAMLASTLTTICVFFPMFFLEGMMMEIFIDLVWVIILSLMCSLIVAVMFLPSIVATFKINPKQNKVVDTNKKPNFWQKMCAGWRNFCDKSGQVFEKTVRFAINKKWLTVALAFFLFIGSACLLLVNGFILMPSTDEGTLSISASLTNDGKLVASGNVPSMNIEDNLTQPLYDEVMSVLGADIEKCIIAYDSGANVLSGGVASINMQVKLKDERSLTTDQASEKLYKALKDYDKTYFAAFDVATSSMASGFMASEVSVTLTVDASANGTKTAYEVSCEILDDFSAALAQKFDGQMDELGIRAVIYDQNKDIKIQKFNGRYVATVSIKSEPSADTTKIQSVLNKHVDELMKSDEFKDKAISILGNDFEQQMTETYSSMGMALLVGFLLIYLVMVAIFQSFLMPFIILICVPLGFTGAFMLLAMCGMPLSLPALIGCLILMGVIINNGILAVDYANQARRDGLSIKDALVASVRTRLRPIFMTALTTILAMIPMAFGWSLFNQGGSTALMQPLAVVSIGGLLFGTVTTLLVVPAFYAIFCRDKKTKTITAETIEAVK